MLPTRRNYSITTRTCGVSPAGKAPASPAEAREFGPRNLLQFHFPGKSVESRGCNFPESTMKRPTRLSMILALCGLFSAFGVASHPYDSALIFHEHLTDDGRAIYSNIPKKCFSKGRLTCTRLHPIFKGSGTIKKPVN